MQKNLSSRIMNMNKKFTEDSQEKITKKISFLLAIFMSILMLFKTSVEFSLIGGLSISFLPYIFFKLKQKKLQVETSMEGNILVSEILNNYRMHSCNVSEAILNTIYTIEDAPCSKGILIPLAVAMDTATSDEAIKSALDKFDKALGTFWSKSLANNLYYGYAYGVDITVLLESLLNAIVKSKKIIEYNRRSNNESKIIIKWIMPSSFLLIVFIACNSFNFSIKKFFQYQFLTTTGLNWFVIFLSLYVISILLYILFGKRKMDI